VNIAKFVNSVINREISNVFNGDIVREEIKTYADVMRDLGYVKTYIESGNGRYDAKEAIDRLYTASKGFTNINKNKVDDALLWTECFKLATQFYIQKMSGSEPLTNHSFMIDDIQKLTLQYFESLTKGINILQTPKEL
jgi:hypothetical protein